MRMVVGFTIILFASGSVFAQHHANYSNPTPVVVGGVGSAVFPAGTPATNPGIQRFNPSVINPGGGGPHLVVPNGTARPARRANTGSFIYPYPVYVGSFGGAYDSSDYTGIAQGQQQPSQQPNITIVMPPQQAPIVVNQYDPTPHPRMSVYQPETAPAPQADDTSSEPNHYLLAFKDHTIYSAVAYWVDGDTLHYFTSGNTHNQVSVSLIDRAMTERLNKDSGVDVKLPPLK